MTRLSYAARAREAQHPAAKKLLSLIAAKKTNLALSADVTHAAELVALTEKLGPEICVLKTHIDIITDFTEALTQELTRLAKQHEFVIFEDRKFADIGNTVRQQYAGGIYHIAAWADLINAHALPGDGVIQGLAVDGVPLQRGLLLLAQMSSANNLLDATYTEKTVRLAERYPELVIGFIAQQKLTNNPGLIHFTPGVQFATQTDTLGQQYITPETAIAVNGTDVIIVGRGILEAENSLLAAQEYRHAGWQAYTMKLPA